MPICMYIITFLGTSIVLFVCLLLNLLQKFGTKKVLTLVSFIFWVLSHTDHDEGNQSDWQGDNDDRGDEGDQSDLILFDSAALPELTTNWHSEGGNAQIILGSHDNDKDYYVDDDDGDYNDDIVVDDDDQIIMAVKAMLRMMTRIAMRMMP